MDQTISPSLEIARSFLQTVLVVDDRAELGPAADALQEGASETLPSDSEAVTSSDQTSPNATLPTTVDDEQSPGAVTAVQPHGGLVTPGASALAAAADAGELNAKTVIDSFAKLGLICGVIRPQADDPLNETVGPAASRADILVLDWWLNRDEGQRSLDIIRHVVTDIDDKHRLRMIVIYTGVQDLEKIARRIASQLDSSTVSGPNRVVAGPVHVTVLAKPDTKVSDDLKAEVVEFGDLAARVIDEFARAVMGLLPNVVLSSFAALRGNTHRVLSRFSKDLDSAYLGHRMLLRHPEAAEELVAGLVAQEISAILDNAQVGELADAATTQSLIDAAMLQARDVPPVGELASSKSISIADYAFALVKKGVYDSTAGLSNSQRDKAHKWTGKIYAPNDDLASDVDLRFAALVKFKSHYENPTPKLRLGVFVRDESADQFMLCMQPVCDSLRLVGDTSFPFLPLNAVEDGFDFVTEALGGLHRLRLDLRIRSLQMITFRPGLNPPGVVEAEEDKATGAWVFRPLDTNAAQLRWIGELREGWAHMFANRFADSVSRVGMDDSEWARRSGPDR
jgi:hypothetical protein